MTLTAFLFGLQQRRVGRLAGVAVIASAARYVTVYYFGAERLARRFGRAAEWRAVQSELTDKMPSGQFPRDSAISNLLLGSELSDLRVVYIRREAVNVPKRAAASRVLDQLLRDTSGAP